MCADQCKIYVNSKGFVLGLRGGWAYAIQARRQPRRLFPIKGDCVLHNGICEDSEGGMYFGEYFMNPRREPVSLWRIFPDLSSWQLVYEFSPSSIRHIHAVCCDPYDPETFWVTVGDTNGECFIVSTRDRFNSLTFYGDGTQTWRAVSLFFTEHHICWLTDSETEQNYACRMDRVSGKLEIGQPMDCSTWYGATTVEGLHIALTTVEDGASIKSKFSSIMVSKDAFVWHQVYKFKKGFFRPNNIFKPGVIYIPTGKISAQKLYLSGQALLGFDGISMALRIIV
jgi:hypothetical protein